MYDYCNVASAWLLHGGRPKYHFVCIDRIGLYIGCRLLKACKCGHIAHRLDNILRLTWRLGSRRCWWSGWCCCRLSSRCCGWSSSSNLWLGCINTHMNEWIGLSRWVLSLSTISLMKLVLWSIHIVQTNKTTFSYLRKPCFSFWNFPAEVQLLAFAVFWTLARNLLTERPC